MSTCLSSTTNCLVAASQCPVQYIGFEIPVNTGFIGASLRHVLTDSRAELLIVGGEGPVAAIPRRNWWSVCARAWEKERCMGLLQSRSIGPKQPGGASNDAVSASIDAVIVFNGRLRHIDKTWIHDETWVQMDNFVIGFSAASRRGS